MNLNTCVWYDHTAKEAAKLYKSAFEDVEIISENDMVVMFKIYGTTIMGLNGGNIFRPNPAFSFFVSFSTSEATEKAWDTLAKEGKPLMSLNKYEWNEKYGWIADKYGVNWQLWTGDFSNPAQKVVPVLMFCGKNQGRASEAIDFYTDLVPDSSVGMEAHYTEASEETGGQLVHAEFILNNTLFKAFDSAIPQSFDFNEGISLVIHCDTQQEIDYYWDNLTRDGGQEGMCGWCKDKFGVSWQVVPSILPELMQNPDKTQKVVDAFLKMKKFDIETLLNV